VRFLVFAWQRWKTVVLEKNVSRETKCFVFVAFFGLEKHVEGYQVQLYYGTRTKLDSLPCLIGKATERNPSLILVWYQNQVGLVAFFEWKSNRKEAQVQLYFGTRTKLDSLHFLIGKALERSPSPTLFWHQKEIGLGPLFSSISKPKKHRGQLYAGTREKLDLGTFFSIFRTQKDTESNFKLVPEWSWTRCFSSFEKEEKRRPSPTLIWYQFKVGLGAFLASTRKRKGGRVQL
jgi:hypothetical protein